MMFRNAIGKTVVPAMLAALFILLAGMISLRLSPVHADTGSFTLSANPSSATVAQGGSADYSITITPSGYSGTVNLSVASCPPGATCLFYNSDTEQYDEASKSVRMSDPPVKMRITTSATGTPIGSYSNITVIGTDSVNQSLFASSMVLLTVTQGKGFSISVPPISINEDNEHQPDTTTISLNRYAGFDEDVTVTWSMRPANGGVTFDPSSGNVTLAGGATSADITITARSQTAGTYTLDFTGTSETGIVHTATGVTLSIAGSSCAGGTDCGTGQTCTANGCRMDPAPTSSSCNVDACYTFNAGTGAQMLKSPAPDGCWASWPACQNVSVLKVRKDRQCNQWLGCKASIAGTVTQGDGTSKLTEPQCTQLGVCAQLGPDGRCLQYINPGADKANISFETPGDVTGSNSLIRWFSGYSSGFHYMTDQSSPPKSLIQSNFPAVDINEIATAGAGSELVPNGNFGELRCVGGPHDRMPCIVPSDCRTGSGVCVDVQESIGPVGTSSNQPCASKKECDGIKVGSTPTPYCRYLASWGGDVVCRNPQDSQWLGVLKPNAAWLSIGYGFKSPSDPNNAGDIQSGIRRTDNDTLAVEWKVWQDEANFTASGADRTSADDPRYPPYAPQKHIKEGDNFLKVTIEPKALEFSGVGVKLAGSLQTAQQYALSFRFKTDSQATALPIQAQLQWGYESSGQGYQKNAVDDKLAVFGVIGGSDGSKTVCSNNATVACGTNAECGGGTCVDTRQWQDVTMMLPRSLTSVGNPVFVQFVSSKVNGTTPFTFYLDDVSLKPVLNTAVKEGGDIQLTSDLVKIPRRCRLYPKINSPDCNYADRDGTNFTGWRGYCLDRDPRNGNLCLTWWPLDILAGESALGLKSSSVYTGPVPLFQCLEQEGGPLYYKSTGAKGCDYDGCTVDLWNDDKYSDGTGGWPLPANQTIKLRDIEAIDVWFQPADWIPGSTDEQQHSGHWWYDESPDVRGATSWARKTDDNSYWFHVDLQQFNRVTSDGGYRLSVLSPSPNKSNYYCDKDQGCGDSDDERGSWRIHTLPWSKVLNQKCGDSSQIHNLDVLFQFDNPSNPDEAKLSRVNFFMCYGGTSDSMRQNQLYKIVIRTRQSCNYIVQTVGTLGGIVDQKSWSNRVKDNSQYRIPKLDTPYLADAVPFGAISPASVGNSNPDQWGSWTVGENGVDDNGIRTLEPASGAPRAGVPYSLSQAKSFDQYKYCYVPVQIDTTDADRAMVPDDQLNNRCELQQDVSKCIATATASQCIGRPVKHCSADNSIACQASTDCRGHGDCVGESDAGGIIGAKNGAELLKHVFAKSLGCWRLTTELLPTDINDTNKGKKIVMKYVAGCGAAYQEWDASSWPDCAVRPTVTNTNLTEELCKVPAIVSVDSINGVVKTSEDPLMVAVNDQVTLKFSYSIDAAQLPATYMKVIPDWSSTSKPTASVCEESTKSSWFSAQSSPVVNVSIYDSAGTYHPAVCVKDNWGAIGSDVFEPGITVTP